MATAKKCKYVLVRTNSADMHTGELVSQKGKEVVLKNSRRIWYWKGANSLSELAMYGVKYPNECKFGVPVTKIVLTEAIEIIDCSKDGEKNIRAVPEWRA